MGAVDTELIPVSQWSDAEIAEFFSRNGISLKVDEGRKIVKLIGRDPTITELHIFNVQWSEHSSYKSSRHILKKYLPTTGKTVILGPGEDSGIVELARIGKDRYGIVIGHESHNHPSQVVPYEGAATGVGGIVRDVLCMGAKVIGLADALRFGNPNGKKKNYVKYVANAVVDGIAGYSNPLGVPNVAGDVYFSDSFDDNCLVNVVCTGLVKERDIIHSRCPKNAAGYDIVIVGKATDNSGFGGAAFASLALDEEEANKGAVQVPDPFLKNVLLRATEAVFNEARKKGIELGFKDMGAGGIMCSTAEMVDAAGYGADVNLDRVHVSMSLPPYVIACGETQERLTWVSPKEFTTAILKIYNEDFALPEVAEKAEARVIGKVTAGKDYILRFNGRVVCNIPVEIITRGISYEREARKPNRIFSEPNLKEPRDYGRILLDVLSHPNVASKAMVYKHYDTEVEGLAVIRPGEADAGVQAPLPGKKFAYSLTVDCNPIYCRIDPYLGSINAVAETMRNTAAVGAVPYALTDCLNFGNPEKPEAFYDFVEAVKGISDAAKNIYLKGTKKPVPFVSGNVSFYNESKSGKAIDPSAIVACIGNLKDYGKAITMKIKEAGSALFLIGDRKDELGGSVYYQLHGEIGKSVPRSDFSEERGRIYMVIDAIDKGLLLSCHDISDGGLSTTISEMVLGGEADGEIGASLEIGFSDLRNDKILFSESSGFVFEVDNKNINKVKNVAKKYKVNLIPLGKTIKEKKLVIHKADKKIIDTPIEKLKKAWTTGFVEAMR